MSYQRRTADRTRALRAKYGVAGSHGAPRAHHALEGHSGGAMVDRKKALKAGKIKHKGDYDND